MIVSAYWSAWLDRQGRRIETAVCWDGEAWFVDLDPLPGCVCLN